MREIEFRGHTSHGQLIFGDLIHVELRNYFPNGTNTSQIVPSINGQIVEDYAQLVGRDKNNQKVFEGDILIDDVENEYVAEIYMRPGRLAELILKC